MDVEISEPASFWRDGALPDAWLMHAHYREHRFERHLHDEMVIVVTERGAGEVETRFGTDSIAAGTVWVFAAGEYHGGRVRCDEGWHYRAIYLNDASLTALAAVFASGGTRRPFVPPGRYEDAQVAGLLAQAHRSLQHQSTLLERQALWWEGMGLLFGRYGQPRAALAAPGHERTRLRLAREYIAMHFRSDFSIDDLSQVTGLSRFHLMRSFRKAYGLPPHAYANQLKLVEAKRLLQSGQPAAEVAADVGFYDQSHLTRLFKRAFDLTPGRFAALGSAR